MMQTPTPPPFLKRDGDLFVPGPHGRSPWDDQVLHGRLLAGLAAHVVEERHGSDEFQYSRLTIDMFRPPPLEPIDVRTTVVRDGNRIRLVDASIVIGDKEVARTSVVMLRKTDQPPGTVWTPEPWDAPHPDQIELPEAYRQRMRAAGGEGRAWFPPWETRPISRGGFGSVERKSCWLRENRELVDGVELTPFVRVAVAADYTSPFANSGDQGLNYINADITVYLHRLPVDEWIGFEVADFGGTDGVCVGDCRLYDTQGPIGLSTVCAVAQIRRPR